MTFFVLLGVLLILVILLRLVRHAEGGGGTSRISPASGILTSIFAALGAPSRIVVNGQAYASVDEMPTDVRAEYEQAMGLALDVTGRDGIIDFPRGARARNRIAGTISPPDHATRLRQLQEIRDSGLITEEEYEAKRAEILSSL